MLKRRDWIRQAALMSTVMGLPALEFLGTKEITSHHHIHDDGVVRLLFNENPYGPSKAILDRIDEIKSRSNRYASFHQYDYTKLKALIAKQEGVSPDNIALGHGSIQPLIWLAILYGGKGKEFIVPAPAFDVTGSFGRKIGTKVVQVRANDDLKTDLKGMEKIVSGSTDLVSIVNPNNPTGTTVSTAELRSFCTRVSKKCIVSIDEAYIHYLGKDWKKHSMAGLVNEHPNVVVTRTFSKIYGMAGQRMGIIMGSKDLIKKIEDQFMMGFPGNMPNTIGVASAMAALEDEAFLESSREKNNATKELIYARLKKWGWDYVPSDANFVYFKTPDFAAFKKKMNDNKILLAGGWPSHKEWGRVTVGTEDEVKAFFRAVEGI